MSELPKGWTTTNLQQLFELKYGKGLVKEKRNSTGSINVYGSNGVVGKHSSALTKGPAIIIGRKGSVGEINFSPDKCWPIDTTYYIDEFPDDLPPKYWTLYLKFLRLSEGEKSSAIPGINRDDIYKIEVHLPPLNEQRRIVSKLEKLLSRVEAAQARLAKIPLILKRFRQSVLAAACSGRLTADWRKGNLLDNNSQDLIAQLLEKRKVLWEDREQSRLTNTNVRGTTKWKQCYKPPFMPNSEIERELPASWVQVTVSQVALLDVGFAFKSLEYSKDGIRLLRGENIEPESLRWQDVRFWPRSRLNGYEHLLIKEGEIILAMDRPLVSAGLKIARAKSSDLPCLLVQRMTRFKIVDDRITSFLYFNLQLNDFREQLSEGMTGSDLPHITGNGLAKYTFGLPPAVEQQEIVGRVDALFKTADVLEARYLRAKAHVEGLTQSILARAFRGELVEQNANDGRVAAILERIQEADVGR